MKKIFAKTIFFLTLIFLSFDGKAYSVFAHEALIDASWDRYLKPLIQLKFPGTNDSMLKEAHAYAYGGAVAPDMGYYPFGSKLFTNLLHYVRSGDFVENILNEAQTANEYAFALGCMYHYYADVYGHSLGVNVSVPIQYPRDKEKYGNVVTYEQDEIAHKRVEFAFDVMETAKGNYAPNAYRNYIGFKVADSVLERAFYKTYSLHLTDIFRNFSRAVNTFRWTVKNIFPEITKTAWLTKKKELVKKNPTLTARHFKYHMRRVNYNKEFGRNRDKPGFFAYFLAALIKILPKIGPLKPLKFKVPGPEVEKNYIESFNTVLAHDTAAVKKLATQKPDFKNKDFDTGRDVFPGEYGITDDTYYQLLLKLKDNNYTSVTPSLKENIVHFFRNPELIFSSSKEKEKQQKVLEALSELKSIDLKSTRSTK